MGEQSNQAQKQSCLTSDVEADMLWATSAFGQKRSLATESEEMFLKRINKLERDEDDTDTHGDPDSENWTMGAQLRVKGSVHSDVWVGTAAQLATKSQIAVIPVGGWWKDWKEAGQFRTTARYALVVSLEVSESVTTAVDLYAPIAAKTTIAVPAQVTTIDIVS